MIGFQRRGEGVPLKRGFNIYPRGDRFNRGFVFKLGPVTFGIRWQRHLRRLYLRYGGTTRVLIGKNRHYDLTNPFGQRIFADRIRIERLD